jgi:uncharacterized membrane-anchored protein YitT (DUF2179 family)
VAWRIVRDYIGISVGVVLTAIGLDMFLIPNRIAAGGVSGIGTLVYYLTGFPVGITMLAINIPLFIMGIRELGLGFGIRSLYGTITLSLAVDLMAGGRVPVLTKDPLLAALYGGIVTGIGIGLVFRFKGTTGGTDLAAAIVNRYIKASVGLVLFVIDAAVIVAAGIVWNPELALYALLTVFITARVIDVVQEGFGYAKAALIISERPEEVSAAILRRMDRGATALHGRGLFTGMERDVILSVVTRAEVSLLKDLVQEVDPRAFVILADVHEVLGEGFKRR